MFMFVQLPVLKKEKLVLNMTESDDIPVLSNQNGDLVVKEERLLILQFCIEGCYKQWLKKIWSHINYLKCTFDGAFWGVGGIEVEFECMAHNKKRTQWVIPEKNPHPPTDGVVFYPPPPLSWIS